MKGADDRCRDSTISCPTSTAQAPSKKPIVSYASGRAGWTPKLTPIRARGIQSVGLVVTNLSRPQASDQVLHERGTPEQHFRGGERDPGGRILRAVSFATIADVSSCLRSSTTLPKAGGVLSDAVVHRSPTSPT
jgi:hypothetical protein